MAPDETHIDPDFAIAEHLVSDISAMLAGKGLEVQAMVCTDLVALFLAGWPSQQRAEVVDNITALALKLVPEWETKIHGPAGHPSNDGRA